MTAFSIKQLKGKANIHHPTTKYAIEVVEGLRVACKYEILSCRRHLDDLARQGTDHFPYVFDESRANRIFDWFRKCCRHVKGVYSGQPIELVDFQRYDLGCLFGWVHRETGKRRFKFSYNKVARGHAKSTCQSGIATYGMCGDCYYPPGHPEKRIYDGSPMVECFAADKEQAKIVFNDAWAMADGSPDIRKRLDVKRSYVRHKTRGGHMRALSKDLKNKNGLNPTIVICDEYHEHPTSEMYDVISSSFGKRPQNLMNVITTAGKNAENNPCKREEDMCKKMLDGEIPLDDTYFIIIRELDKEDNPHDKEAWKKANPFLQIDNEYSKGLRDIIETEYKKAYGANDHAKIREFVTKRCNLWVNDSDEKFFTEELMTKYKSLAIPREELEELVKGKVGYFGLDLSKTIDLTGAGNVFKLNDGRFAIMAHGFIPEDSASRHEKTDRVPYRDWAKEGWCTLTPGGVVDYKFLLNHFYKQETDLGIVHKEICYDPYNAEYATQDLEREGYTRVEVRQGVQTLSEPTKYFRQLVIEGNLVHDGNPLLTWCVSNAIEIIDSNGNIKLSKKHKDDNQRIDLLAAVINALSRAMAFDDNKVSVYEERGIRSI